MGKQTAGGTELKLLHLRPLSLKRTLRIVSDEIWDIEQGVYLERGDTVFAGYLVGMSDIDNALNTRRTD